jgi:hypothetical protein
MCKLLYLRKGRFVILLNVEQTFKIFVFIQTAINVSTFLHAKRMCTVYKNYSVEYLG